jgi:hypothetical protein
VMEVFGLKPIIGGGARDAFGRKSWPYGKDSMLLPIHVSLRGLMSHHGCPLAPCVLQVDEVWEKYPQIKEEVEKEIEEHQWFKDTK